jgi:NitT/TauT family transport system ATP-binding protein
VSLAIPAGAFVAIVGPSGCGKSTLLNIAAGLVPPSSGSVRVDGEGLSGLNRRATYMFQQDALLPWKNVRENVALGLVLAGVASADAQRTGERVACARRALGVRRALSVAAERRDAQARDDGAELDSRSRDAADGRAVQRARRPHAAADGNRAAQFVGSNGDRRDRPDRKTVVFVTHDLEEAIALADEVVVLSAGPASHVVARHPVALDRPRDLFELRTSAAFIDLYRSLWAILRDEVIKSQRDA